LAVAAIDRLLEKNTMRFLSREEGTLRPHAKSLSNEFQNFVHDVERVVKNIQDSTGSGLSSARSELEGRVSRAKATLADAGRSAMEHAGETKDAVTDYMERRPVAALAVAVAVGALIAFAISRMGSRSHNEPFRWER
jgi:ElaB/YqjD/DUF883 family membrane-anchored ribosome-binding protein